MKAPREADRQEMKMGGSTKKAKGKGDVERVGRIAIVAFMLVIGILFLIIMRSNRSLSLQVEGNYKRIAQLKDSIKDEEERGEQIEQLRQYMQTDEYAELQARIRLGMVKPNEIMFEETR